MATRIERLANNSTMYYRGDSCMEISPFTNYYLFTIYRESNDETIDDHIPLNLTNLGTVWLSFISGKTKIRVPNYTGADNVDTANGEVVFRISEEDATRILSLSTKTFYISTSISDGTTSSDETVLFSGTWSEYSSAMKNSLTDTVTELKARINDLQAKLDSDTKDWTSKLNELNSEIEKLKSENDRLSAQNMELETKIKSIDDSYIEAKIIIDAPDRSIPQETSKKDANKKITPVLETNMRKLEKTALKSTFKYTE